MMTVRVQDDITCCRQDIKEKYEELFEQALAEYNARRTQSSRKIPDYCEHIRKSSKGKPYYEIVEQFGYMDSCGQGSGKLRAGSACEEDKLMLDVCGAIRSTENFGRSIRSEKT